MNSLGFFLPREEKKCQDEEIWIKDWRLIERVDEHLGKEEEFRIFVHSVGFSLKFHVHFVKNGLFF